MRSRSRSCDEVPFVQHPPTIGFPVNQPPPTIEISEDEAILIPTTARKKAAMIGTILHEIGITPEQIDRLDLGSLLEVKDFDILITALAKKLAEADLKEPLGKGRMDYIGQNHLKIILRGG